MKLQSAKLSVLIVIADAPIPGVIHGECPGSLMDKTSVFGTENVEVRVLVGTLGQGSSP